MNAWPFHLSKLLPINSAPLFPRKGLKSIRQPGVSRSPSVQPCSVIRVSNGPPAHLRTWRFTRRTALPTGLQMKRRNLVIATFNKGKLQELRELLSELPFEISDLEGFSSIQAVPEVGRTFVENASLKAS